MNHIVKIGVPAALGAAAAFLPSTPSAAPVAAVTSGSTVSIGSARNDAVPEVFGFEAQFWQDVWGATYDPDTSYISLSGTDSQLFRVTADQDLGMSGLYSESCQMSSPTIQSMLPADIPGFNVEYIALTCGRFLGPSGYDRSIFGVTVDYSADLGGAAGSGPIADRVLIPFGEAGTLDEAVERATERFNLYNRDFGQLTGELRGFPPPAGPDSWEDCMDQCRSEFDQALNLVNNRYDQCMNVAQNDFENLMVFCAVSATGGPKVALACTGVALLKRYRAQNKCDTEALKDFWPIVDRLAECIRGCWRDFPEGPAPPSINDIPGLIYGNYRYNF